jgi:hypothetical protein
LDAPHVGQQVDGIGEHVGGVGQESDERRDADPPKEPLLAPGTE